MLTVIKDIVVIGLSRIALIVSTWTFSEHNPSNKLASDANKLSKETSESSLKFSIIEAENTWRQIRDAYDEIDDKILSWENDKKLIRDGLPSESINALELLLDKLNVPREVRRLYIKRHEKYDILQNVSDQYQPFKERLAHIDFKLPAPPVLPGVTTKDGGGSAGSKDGGGGVGTN